MLSLSIGEVLLVSIICILPITEPIYSNIFIFDPYYFYKTPSNAAIQITPKLINMNRLTK